MPIDPMTLAAFALITGAVFLVARKVQRFQQDPTRERLATVAEQSPPLGQGLVDPRLVDGLSGLLPEFRADHGGLGKELRRAGYYKPTAVQEFLALRNALVIGAALLTGVIAVAVGPERPNVVRVVLVVGLAVTGMCWGLPRVIVSLAGNRRSERIRSALPYALDMIGMCLTGGMSIYQALVHVSREIEDVHPDLALELLIIQQQADMNSMHLALEQFSHRIDLPDVAAMAALITQNQKLGTNISETMLEFADNIRLRRRQTADERSTKAQLKLLLPVALCLMPSFFMIVWGPAIMELVDFVQTLESPSDAAADFQTFSDF